MESKTIGIIGGGQLCKMLIEAGIKWDLKFNILESDQNPTICGNQNLLIRGSLHNSQLIQALSDKSDILTYELENINADKLLELELAGKTIIPSPKILKLIQNKLSQKEFMANNGIPTAPFQPFTNRSELNQILFQYQKDKFVVKKCVGGYDGKGVLILTRDTVEKVDLFSGLNLFEEFIDCKAELAIIVARDQQGNITSYPVVESVFNMNNTLDYQVCPANISPFIETQVRDIAIKTVDKLQGVGIFAVELFLTSDDQVLVNEVSARPHNSGHYTIEATNVSQYEQLLRILLGYPVRTPIVTKASVTMNLLGPENHTGYYELANRSTLMAMPDCHIHLYGKRPTTPNRKLGHITILDDSLEKLLDKFNLIKQFASIVPVKHGLKHDLHQDVQQVGPIVGVIMGSISDKEVMQEAIDVLTNFGISFEIQIVSAHRTPDLMFQYAKEAEGRGLQIIIAGAGGAAHLPGMCSSLTNLPVIGVPVKTSALSGLDSLYSIVQMPRGVPVATMAINGSKNAGLLAIRMLAINDLNLKMKLNQYIANMHKESVDSNRDM